MVSYKTTKMPSIYRFTIYYKHNSRHKEHKSLNQYTSINNKSMKSLQIIALAAVSVVSVTSSALAGTSVTNSTTTRNSIGTVKTDVSIVKNTDGVQTNYSQSLKMESLAPTAFASVNFTNGHFSGNAWGSTETFVDPVAVGVYSTQHEVLNVSEHVNINTIERATFTEIGIDHTVSTDSF